jgi:hypothetical protein
MLAYVKICQLVAEVKSHQPDASFALAKNSEAPIPMSAGAWQGSLRSNGKDLLFGVVTSKCS